MTQPFQGKDVPKFFNGSNDLGFMFLWKTLPTEFLFYFRLVLVWFEGDKIISRR
jgi:hypothetical protein